MLSACFVGFSTEQKKNARKTTTIKTTKEILGNSFAVDLKKHIY